MGLVTAELNVMADAESARVVWVSLHTADPSTTGANEVTGGSPAYARKQAVRNAAAGGVAALTASLLFDIPAGTTVTHIGYWSAVTGGTFRGSVQLGAPESFAGQGQLSLTAASLAVANA